MIRRANCTPPPMRSMHKSYPCGRGYDAHSISDFIHVQDRNYHQEKLENESLSDPYPQPGIEHCKTAEASESLQVPMSVIV